MNENVTVCITPKGEKPVLHFSQFDNERVFTVTVLADDGESAAVLTGLDIEFRLRKTDSHVVTVAPESVSDNVITFKTTEQMCACCGQNIASVTLMKDDMNIATLDILVDIQRDILSGGLTSESDIRNLTSQIEQIVPEVIGDDYYNKQEVDDKIAEIPTFDPSNYYDKSDVDGLLADKADADDVYTKSDVYNKIETDNLLSAKMDNIGYHGVVDDAAVISFTTDCNAPLDIIKGKITPVQSGTGTPSPDNVRPISGFSALNVTRTGMNLCYQVISGASISGGGQIVSEPSYAMGCALLKKGVTYTVTTQEGQLVGGYFSSSPTIGSTAYDNTRFVLSNKTITPTKDCYIAFRMPSNYTTQPQVNIGSTALPYVAYNGQTTTVNFGQTVYGGVADVTNGKVTITHGIVDLGTLTWSATGNMWFASLSGVKPIYDTNVPDAICSNYKAVSWVSGTTGTEEGVFCFLPAYNQLRIRDTSYSSASDFQTAMSGVQLVYELATPIEITTTPVTVSSIAGGNNIFLDTGNMTEIAYFGNAEDNLIKLIKACQI